MRNTVADSKKRMASVAGVVSIASSLGIGMWASPAAHSADTAQADSLEMIVVTATRREDTISRVPMSITAFTGETLAAQGVKSISDLRLITPGLGLSFGNLNPGLASGQDTNISLRGVAALAGAATTGVYIDDVPTHKSSGQGSGFGATYPKLFDIERVEVLRGPQGTLYGGSTMGGAVRFITASPNLTDYSGNAKAEFAFTENGEPSYEAGVAFGGPIIADKLGFRVTAWARREGGYLDHASRFTGRTLAEDTNDVDSHMVRAALAWAPVEAAKITASILWQDERRADTDQYWFDTPAINAPAIGFNANGRQCFTVPVTNCAKVLPAHTYGPYNMFGPGKNGEEFYDPTTGAEQPILQPRNEKFYLPSLTLDYDFESVVFKSITAYQSAKIDGVNSNGYRTGSPAGVGVVVYPANELYPFPQAWTLNYFLNTHDAVSQEFRLLSQSSGPFSWITGLWYFHDRVHYWQHNFLNIEEELQAVQGVTPQQFLGFPLLSHNDQGTAASFVRQDNYAAYLDVNYALTDRLKLEAGVRYSRDKVDNTFISTGAYNRGNAVATVANGGLVNGSISDSSVTPKVGVTYQINDRDMVYATAAQGYRVGGYQSLVLMALPGCQAVLQQLNLTTPSPAYRGDSVWTYEVGSKLRAADGRAQLNASLYRTDWSDIQTLLNIPGCGQYTDNAAEAKIQGVDLDGAVKLGRFTLSGAVGYIDAKYTSAVFLPTLSGGKQVAILQDDRLTGVPEWSATAGVRYDFPLVADAEAYVRFDYQYQRGVHRTTGPGTTGYSPDLYAAEPFRYGNAGVGVKYGSRLEFLVTAKNLFNSDKPTMLVGGSSATRTSPILFGQTFRPREIALTTLYRF
jgi:outer membrane receptor protein involved in Fe transport